MPGVDDAVRQYEEGEGRLTRNSEFGFDPLQHRPDLIKRRDDLFSVNSVPYDDIFTDIISANGQMFVDTIIYLKTLTIRFTNFL